MSFSKDTRYRLAIALCVLFTGLNAQHTLSGHIYNTSDQSTLVGATVVILDTKLATVSDQEGYFFIEDIASGTYIAEVSSVGFITTQTTIELVSSLDIDISIKEKLFDLPDIVVESVTMTGGASGVKNSLGSAHYIGQKEIQKFSYTDINRTLRNIPGVNIQEEDGYGLRPNIGLRATGSERSSKITVMEDGILAAPAPYAAPAAYYFPTVGRMEAIEILKGSSQIKYGPYTTGGAINLISTPLPIKFNGHADFITGSNNYKMLHANIGNAHDNVSYLVETLQFSADGFKQLDNGGDTGFDKQDFMAKVRVHTNQEAPIYQSLTFKIGQANEMSNETYLGLTAEDFDETPLRRYAGSQEDVMNTKHSQYSLTHFAQLTDFLDIHTSLYRNEFSRNWYKLDKVGGQSISNILNSPSDFPDQLSIIKGGSDVDNTNALAVKANNRSYYSKGLQTNLIFHHIQGSTKHRLDIGIRVHQDEIDRFQWVDLYNMNEGTMQLSSSGTPGTESNRVGLANATAIYGQYKVEVDRLTVTAGMRHEHISISRDDYGKEDTNRSGANLSSRENIVAVWIPGVAASFKISTKSKLFGGIHRGFAPPGSKEGTEPEKSWNYEMGYRLNTPILSGQVVAYLNDYSNLLGSDLAATGGLGSQDLFNGGSAIARGIEAEVSYDIGLATDLGLRLPVSLTYTYSDTYFTNSFESEFEAWESVDSGDKLPYVPTHQLAMSLSLEHQKVLFDISTRYSTGMLAQAGDYSDATIARTDDAFTVDIAMNYKLSSELSAFLNVNNVLDNTYVVALRPAGLRPNLPRTYNVGLKANF